MDLDAFWRLIEQAATAEDPYESAEQIQEQLAKAQAEEILGFQRRLDQLMAASYTWELWGAGYLINGGCSDDGFEYFRAWLLTQGRAVFEAALQEPDSLADTVALEGDDADCEDMMYVARTAYEETTGKEMPSDPVDYPELGEGWDFEDDKEMKRRYPKLFAKFAEG